jgi:hypothetical protein
MKLANAAWCNSQKDSCLSNTPHENLKFYKEQNYFSLQFVSWKGIPWYSLGNLYGIKMMLISLHFSFAVTYFK